MKVLGEYFMICDKMIILSSLLLPFSTVKALFHNRIENLPLPTLSKYCT